MTVSPTATRTSTHLDRMASFWSTAEPSPANRTIGVAGLGLGPWLGSGWGTGLSSATTADMAKASSSSSSSAALEVERRETKQKKGHTSVGSLENLRPCQDQLNPAGYIPLSLSPFFRQSGDKPRSSGYSRGHSRRVYTSCPVRLSERKAVGLPCEPPGCCSWSMPSTGSLGLATF